MPARHHPADDPARTMVRYPSDTGSVPYHVEFGPARPAAYRDDPRDAASPYDRFAPPAPYRDGRPYAADDRYPRYPQEQYDRYPQEQYDRYPQEQYDRYPQERYADDDRGGYPRDRYRDGGRRPGARDERRPARGGSGKGGSGKDGKDGKGGKGGSQGSHRQAPLLLRGTLAVALLLALAASLARAQVDAGGAGSPTSLVLGQPGAPAAGPAPAARLAGGQVPAPPASVLTGTAVDGGGAATGGAARPATVKGLGCAVKYSVTSRAADRFTAVLTLTNTGSVPLKDWTLRWAYPSAARLSNGWNADARTDSQSSLVRDVGTGRVVAPGASTTLGFVGTFDVAAKGSRTGTGGADPAQPASTGFSLNGVKCR